MHGELVYLTLRGSYLGVTHAAGGLGAGDARSAATLLLAASGRRNAVVRSQMPVAGPVGFDLDLTLINSRPAIMAAWSAVADELGVHIDLADVDTRMGIKLEDEVSYWFPAHGQQAAADSYRRHYVQLAPTMTFALPGAAEALAAVHLAGERAVIITAKHPVS
ncbi:MAG TPA: HAD hydrolase-like protein, partial [Streptosporangiaceae bacterium]|nr:HAD hydrolase-like protein [Streptosporangiaceae bacterium]